MIKNILVPTSGSPTDESVFATALALARPLGAHLTFYHVRVPSGEAAGRTPHLDFCVGPALTEALAELRRNEQALAERAALHVKTFCREHALLVQDAPGTGPAGAGLEVTAGWIEEAGSTGESLLRRARHSDLIVFGRPQHRDYMPTMLIEDILTGSGRPCVIAPHTPPGEPSGTIVVGWKETREAARALGASHPLLERARRVILLSIAEADDEEDVVGAALAELAQGLAWHGISAETRIVPHQAGSVTTLLARTAHDLKADLLVAGGFGHGRLREMVFGGVTQALIDRADLPVFMLH